MADQQMTQLSNEPPPAARIAAKRERDRVHNEFLNSDLTPSLGRLKAERVEFTPICPNDIPQFEVKLEKPSGQLVKFYVRFASPQLRRTEGG